MRRGARRRERGMALLALLAVIVLGSSWYLVSRLNTESGAANAVAKARNTQALNRAKQALIGYVAAQAVKAFEDNPGALPCPEHAWYISLTDKEGGAGPSVGVANPGYGSANCSSIGRYPWRTIGTDKLTDAYGEPLWYVVGPTWRKTSTSTKTTINSYTAGDLTADGQQVIALIIAPGPAINAKAGTTTAGVPCTARNQARSAPAGTMNPLDYIECYNSSTLLFSATGPSLSLNDQVVTITTAELIPAIEAAIANRIEREIIPALKTVYTPGAWGFSGLNPVLPFAAPFANPGTGVGTSAYQGIIDTYEGLLPFNQANCTISASDPRCSNSFLTFSKTGSDTQIAGGGSIRTQSTCVWSSGASVCTGQYNATTVSITFQFIVTNVAMGLRTFDSSKITCTAVDDAGGGWPTQTVPCSSAVALQSDGSAIVTVTTAAMPVIATAGWGTYANYMINIDRLAFGDHSLLDTNDATTGWFARNEWYRLMYYAVTKSNATRRSAILSNLSSERSCSPFSGTYPFGRNDCLSVNTNSGSATKSALLILAGRSINGRTRPSAVLSDYLEFGNANTSRTAFENLISTPTTTSFLVDTGTVNSYTVPVSTLSSGATLQFRALNTNTGTSTLNTTATGTRSLVNQNGSNLSASSILANSAVQVTWDGTQFNLAKRPINDRFATSSSN